MKDMSPTTTKRAHRVQEMLSMAIASGHLHGLATIAKPINITRVWLSPDNKQAKVYFSVIGGDKNDAANIEHALQASTGTAQSLVGKTLKTFSTPKIKFIYDDLLDELDDLNQRFLNN